MVHNLAEIASRQAAARPDDVAFEEAYGDRRTLTWSELDAQVDRFAAWLSGQGLVAGQRVALVLENRLELPVAYLAVLRLGLVAVPVNPRGAHDEVLALCAQTGTRVVVAERRWASTLTETGLRTVIAAPLRDEDVPAARPDAAVAFADALAADGPALPPPPQDPESLAVLMSTSGTSTRPRIVMLSHRALLANIVQVAAIRPQPIVAADRILLVLPLFHVFALNGVLGQALHQGATTVLLDRFDDQTLAEVARGAITVLPVAPPVVAAWCGRPGVAEALAGVRTVLSGAAPIEADLVEEFSATGGTTLHQGYGLTEAAPVVTTTLAQTDPVPGSVGTPVEGLEVRLVDSDGSDAHPDDPGEIWLRGPNLLTGFWPDGTDGPDADGWFATGDVGIRAPDGSLVLVDRLRELVIVSGFNVYPREVEEVLAEAPGVAEVAVVGVGDPYTGEAVRAYVVPVVPDADPEETAERLRAYAALRLAAFKVPRDIEVTDALPHTATGEISKSRLRAAEARRGIQGLL
ncbi:UNVERIFIED_CONTAM: hypothetical protein LK11_02005 [Mumia flava]|nr:AMP-binding protein [Mumia flava]